MLLTSIFLALGCATFALAATNEPCLGKGGAPGVCISTSACSDDGGTSITGACPSDPAGIRCCTKPTCNGGTSTSNCRWSSDCKGASVSNQCPGPAGFKCCKSNANGFGGYSAPSIPAVGGCKAVSVNGAKKVVAQFPGRVRQIYCTRSCSDPSSSDHCTGKAIDFMCSDAGGTATTSGREFAEWAMNNCAAIKCKYVIWGQRIWTKGRDKKGLAWTSWRSMDDRNGITANHWDHVHVSFD